MPSVELIKTSSEVRGETLFNQFNRLIAYDLTLSAALADSDFSLSFTNRLKSIGFKKAIGLVGRQLRKSIFATYLEILDCDILEFQQQAQEIFGLITNYKTGEARTITIQGNGETLLDNIIDYAIKLQLPTGGSRP